ncbi:MAG: hypothetical protein AAF702_30530 [Chloroflexota bacterium]
MSLFLNWFRQLAVHGKVSPEDYEKLDYVYRTKEEVQTMLMEALAEEKRKIYEQGEAIGITKGEAIGRMENQREMIGQLLAFRFELDEAEQENLTQQVADIDKLELLDALVDTLLDKEATFDDFIELLPEQETSQSG